MASSSATAAGGGGNDRLSKLSSTVLGHILSFLPSDEAARAAALSHRWRDVFAHVHTVSLDEPQPPVPDPDGDWSPGWSPIDRNAAAPSLPFAHRLSAALLSRLRLRLRLAGGDSTATVAGVPLRALRAGFHGNHGYGFRAGTDAGILDTWLAYAIRQADDDGELHLDLRLCLAAIICDRTYSLRPRGGAEADEDDGGGRRSRIFVGPNGRLYGLKLPVERFDSGEDEDEDEDYASPKSTLAGDGDDDGGEEELPPPHEYEYVTPRFLFSCSALRSLHIGPCRLDLPPAISLPSLETMHLIQITGRRTSVQRLVSACPRLADLTLEACKGLTELDVADKRRLRRLALRCCHDLAAVAVDSSELRAFEYRGAVPSPPFLTIHGGGIKISSCKLDFCGAEVTDPPELAKLGDFLHLFAAGVESLHLTSARLGCGDTAPLMFPKFPLLRRLELTGILPEDAAAAAIATVTGILNRTPRLEALTLFFMEEPEDLMRGSEYILVDDEELLDGHNLKHDRNAAIAMPEAEMITCLRETTKEINFVHYDGGLGQRTLAKFLLRNAPVVGEVCGEFAQGPLWIQTALMEEIKGWVMNKSANMMFF
ncbi:hypothetical protein HU200_054087 [Digitaria exilis]|uniref:F-box domain-containing protein n=1 Tax=Digitaria exilis TaxID=1010633 RepID=A0A835E839_9POAL|nr:hypothetical protein HU200_054087 [Digitaria exilis]